MTRLNFWHWAGSLGLVLLAGGLPAAEVSEAARTVQVLKEVDVVVVGGSSGGVAAAMEAAKSGARVFLAAPHSYLGGDLSGTYRLWLEPGEQPLTDLAREIFQPAAKGSARLFGPQLAFKYSASQPSAPVHKDTQPPSLLSDGKTAGASKQSVQYNENVALTVDLGKAQVVNRVGLLTFQRPAEFDVQQVRISASPDGQAWTPVTTITNQQPALAAEDSPLPLAASVNLNTRFLKLEVAKSAEAQRILLGEIVVEGPAAAPAEPAATPAFNRLVTPMQAKRVLDQALVQSGVSFLFGSYPSELLRDAAGKPAGVVIVNRSGRQAIVARVVIDATERAVLARLAGAKFAPYPVETQSFRRVVVGGPGQQGDTFSTVKQPVPQMVVDRKEDEFPVHEYTLQIPMRDISFGAFAEAEQMARDLTWTPASLDSSESLFQVPPDAMRGQQSVTGNWPGADRVPMEALQPQGVDRLLVVGACADLSRPAAAKLARPVNLMAVGARAGQAAAKMAAGLSAPVGVRVWNAAPQTKAPGLALETAPVNSLERGEISGDGSVGASPHRRTVPADGHALPVLGEYDVVVVGGGTGGAPAGIGAGRQGARTLLLEYLHSLGGVGTAGLISKYYHGNLVGFTREVDEGVAALGEKETRTGGGGWNPELKIEWYRRALRKAGVDVWYGTLGVGAVVENGRVKGIIVATPQGRGVILAKAVVDSTGAADIAAAAGATCRYTDDTEVAVQGTGLPQKELGARYTNTDYTFVDETDIFDIWRTFVTSRQKFHYAYDLGQLIDTRERRQIVGDAFLTPMDMMLNRTHPDTLVIAKSDFDSHGYTVHPMFLVRPPGRTQISVHVPYRCLLPKGLDGILVTGLGVSAHRDALPVIRMQGDVQNQGYGAGVAAAMAAKAGIGTRAVDIKQLQKHLVEKGILPESVLTEKDSFPLAPEKIAEAVQTVVNDYQGLEYVMAEPQAARPLLQAAWRAATNEQNRLVYAHILGMQGDATGVATLLAQVQSATWDKGWNYTDMGQYGASISPLDSYIIALGRTRDPRALPVLKARAEQLTPKSEFSHFRAMALALEALKARAGAPILANLLGLPGIANQAMPDIKTALQVTPPSPTDTGMRNRALIELVLLRSLYRCGDVDGLGEKGLRQFAQDLHGHYARHARAVLAAGNK
jgi:flavin-dependent dehydrogenase